MASQAIRLWTRRYSCGASGQITQYSNCECSVAVYPPPPDDKWSGGTTESFEKAVSLADGLAGEASPGTAWVQVSGGPLNTLAAKGTDSATATASGADGFIEPSFLSRAAGAGLMAVMGLGAGFAALSALGDSLWAAGILGLMAYGAIRAAELKTCRGCDRAFTVAVHAGPYCDRCISLEQDRQKALAWAEKEQARQRALVREDERRKAEQRRLDAKLREEAGWLDLSPVEFEQSIARLFERGGFNAFVTAQSGDGGIDIELRKGDERRIVQCKRYSGTVGRPDLQRFYGVLMHEGVAAGYFVTTGKFSAGAVEFSKNKPIVLIDLPRLMKMNRGTLSIP